MQNLEETEWKVFLPLQFLELFSPPVCYYYCRFLNFELFLSFAVGTLLSRRLKKCSLENRKKLEFEQDTNLSLKKKYFKKVSKDIQLFKILFLLRVALTLSF
jgi:hypothetical protein